MFRLTILLFVILVAFPLAQSQAQEFVEVDRVELTDIEPAFDGGKLGRLQAITGETLLVSAPLVDDGDPSTQDGAVYVFSIESDGTLTYQQKIEPATRFRFGNTLAADGDWAAIGESSGSGSKVHLYQRSGSTWSPTQLILIGDVPDTPGITVRSLSSFMAMDGDLLAIGNTNANVAAGNITNAGAVVLYRRGLNSIWSHEATLISSAPLGASGFGVALAVSGNTLLVGADNDLDGEVRRGRAYVFQRTAGQWAQAASLAIPDAEGARFGWSVALDGDVAIVGCATCNIADDGPGSAGSFFAYERNLGGGNNWGLRGEFVGSQPVGIDLFSSSLRLRGGALLVGSPGNGAKRAYFFRRTFNGDWQEAFILQSTDQNNTVFGGSVEFVGGRATIGAELYPDTSGSERWGAVHSWFHAGVESCGGNLDAIFCDGYESVE